MQILHIIHGLTTGGAEIDLINKSITLIRKYHCDVTICCLMRRGDLADRAEAAGISVIGPLMRHRYDIWAGGKLRRILSKEWSLVHTHLFAANFVSWLVMMTLSPHQRPHWIAAEHAMAERWGRFILWIDRMLQRNAAFILVPSEATARSYITQGLDFDRIKVISNAIDTDRFEIDRSAARTQIRQILGIPLDSQLIGTVCRLEAIKNLDILIAALVYVPAYLIIIGDGPERVYLAKLVTVKGLDSRVRLLGHRTDIPELLAAMDLFVLPSNSETFGIAVAEALLMEIPVVATAVGGIPEITQNGQFARLTVPGDLEDLVEAIQWVMAHPDAAKECARQGHLFVRNLMSLETVTDQQYKIYQKIISTSD